MSHTKFASSFAPYTPPPDDPSYTPPPRPSTSRAWFPSYSNVSYQSGGVPTFNTSQAGGVRAVEEAEAESGVSAWETRYGMRVDVLSACAYLLGPVSALLLLILETHNDYVRFHAYQSALATTPLLLLRILASLLQVPSFLKGVLTVILIVFSLYLSFRAYIGAASYGLTRFQIPVIGPLADRWVSEE